MSLKTVEIDRVSSLLNLKLEFLFGLPRYLRDSHNSFSLSIFFRYFSFKKAYFFVTISLKASHFALLNNSLSMLRLDFSNF